MAETTADVRRDIELTRDRISNTLEQLEQKVNVTQIVKDNPWPAVGLAVGVGYLLSGSSVDVRASATTLAGLSAAFEQRVEGLVAALEAAIGAPATGGASSARGFSSAGSSSSADSGGNMGHQMATSAAGSQAMPGVSSSMSNAAAAAPGYETRAD